MSTILSDPERFSVYHVLAVTADAWTVEAAVYAKQDLDAWLAGLATVAPAGDVDRANRNASVFHPRPAEPRLPGLQ